MKNKLSTFLSVSLITLLLSVSSAFAGINFEKNQLELIVAAGCNHKTMYVPYFSEQANFDETNIQVSSDTSWAAAVVNTTTNQIEISFDTDELIASYTATISVDDGEKVSELFVHANVQALNIYRLIDDPFRSKTYAIQRNNTEQGSIIAFDPIEEKILSCLTVGKSPTDFVINEDGSELLVVNSVSQSIDVIDLDNFSHKESITLPSYSAWGDVDDTTANIDLGPNDVIYYSDGAWGPVLHVLSRSSGELLQSVLYDGSEYISNDTGFMDFAVTSDKKTLVAMPQYGWSAGGHSSNVAHYSINNDGTINLVKQTSIDGFAREPFEAPVLISDDDQTVAMKTIVTRVKDEGNVKRVLPKAIWSMNPNATVVATQDALYDASTGNSLYDIDSGDSWNSNYTYTKAQAFTSDFTRFVYFDSSSRSLKVVNLIEEIGLDLIGRSLYPNNGAVIISPDVLTWTPLAGIDEYDVYLSTDESAVISANTSSSVYLGRVSGTSHELATTLASDTKYFWRIDPVSRTGVETGSIYNFSVSNIGLDKTEVNAKTVIGHAKYMVDIQLTSENAGVAWSATAEDSTWISFVQNTGTTPSTLSVQLSAAALEKGVHKSNITITTDEGELKIPVQLQVEALNITHIRSDKNTSTVYAISETTDVAAKAYLLEIDSTSETINRVLPVGSSVTDFTIHYADKLIYVTNWKAGNLLAIDQDTFTLKSTLAFQPAGATGYSQGDVYRVAAGVSQRLIVEEEDQWINISLYNTNSQATEDDAHVREGGGAFDPTGRYYYHGENNSSGASIIKFDTLGDVFTNLAEIRPEQMNSYYGSRTVVVSENGERVFWAGAVLDKNLEPVWGTSEMIYSASTDGRYAFGQSGIYDINLRRQILSMPAQTTASGYNSTSKKLIVQVDGALAYYQISSPISIPAPVLQAGDPSYDSVNLSWNDKSLESSFVIQQRVLNSDTWSQVTETSANVTNWIASELSDNQPYEFRIRATTSEYSSSWSNIVMVTTLDKPNQQPLATDDRLALDAQSAQRFSLVDNDSDFDGAIDVTSLVLVAQPQSGQVEVHDNGEITYTPADSFSLSDSFSYTIKDNEGATSNVATVVVAYLAAPVLTAGNPSVSSIQLNWTYDSAFQGYFEIQERPQGSLYWGDGSRYSYALSWTSYYLDSGVTYEYRIRAIYSNAQSQWSNLASATVLGEISGPIITPDPNPNTKPVANADVINMSSRQSVSFNVTNNDSDAENELDVNSIVISSTAKYGEVQVNNSGQITYVPGDKFVNTDSFSYVISDYRNAVSEPVEVSLIYMPTPTLSISNLKSTAIELSWNSDNLSQAEFLLEKRESGSSSWDNMGALSGSTYTDSNVEQGRTYEFRIRSVAGDFSSVWSNHAFATVPNQSQAEPKSEPSSGGSFGTWSILVLLLVSLRSLAQTKI
ncbi:Ig-like domain-containing protein [Catenovulum maritimum]|uniref:Fibronectin type-III domain-containing protein n=1 Tax=Catenovulum maritimum TaxID=1513271 RepID=A0A0J8GT08_9ALTE|nr:Ig-like domain-containing protein [Catenovulum maritimum]KMT64424.1 hypothetical protein XM47_14090 [Catenovulum maritimum]